ncbi:hypothetical protein JAAARDRAFT_37263 [Jaapia argillacea MUCL 33604]|uniref:F-box domain-containing protein n=1 Tax=Jaapia argillacea MUCL 33604 TaxID=933084 RepID=A0A067PPV7_9AGAM|nr:hypothetical protein JAAARDRAFT_37263 [Jaapia argillacea MUCL 33604]
MSFPSHSSSLPFLQLIASYTHPVWVSSISCIGGSIIGFPVELMSVLQHSESGSILPLRFLPNVLRKHLIWRPQTISVLEDVPADVYLEIVKFLPCSADILHLSLTCSTIFSYVIPALYSSVTLESPDQCSVTLSMLASNPHIARHVRKLVVRPSSSPGQGFLSSSYQYGRRMRSYSPVDGYLVAAAVRQAARHLDALNVFIWDGEDGPPYDDMWFALRMGCPQLEFIGTTIGATTPSPRSHLFDFKNLKGFSLQFRSGFYDPPEDMWDNPPSPFARLWAMLTERCPDLEELTIDGISAQPTDGQILFNSCWPKLRKLGVGPVLVQFPTHHHPQLHNPIVNPNQPQEPEIPPLISFLSNHPTIQDLSLPSSIHVPPSHLTLIPPISLPNLKTYTGSLSQLPHLPASALSQLTDICLSDPLVSREIMPGVLASCKSLRKLSVVFSIEGREGGGYWDNVGVLRGLVGVCPSLRELEVVCGVQPAFSIESFSRAIRTLTKLQSLTLTIVKVPGDESMTQGAARIALANPRLRRLMISYISRGVPLRRDLPARNQAYETGTYDIIRSPHNLPIALSVLQRTLIPWPLSLNLNSRSRPKYKRRSLVHDLRPVGHPGLERKGWGGLLVEKSQAGEEMRLLVLCVALVGFAVWGFVGMPFGKQGR